MKVTDKIFISEFKDSGENEVDIQFLFSAWNCNFSLSQWNDEFTLVKVMRSRKILKSKISQKQAFEIINLMRLTEEKSEIFTSGSTWKSEF